MINSKPKVNPEQQATSLVQDNQSNLTIPSIVLNTYNQCEDNKNAKKLRWLLEAVLLIILIILISIKFKAPACMKQWPQFGDYLNAYSYGDPVDFTKINKKNYNQNVDILSPIGMQYAVNLLNLLGKNTQNDRFLASIQQKQKQFYQSKYHTNKYQDEIQFCVIVQSYNNQANNRIKANLDSIFQQNYENYFLVYVNDFSTDNTKASVKQYMQNNSIANEKTTFISNDITKGKVKNQYQIGHKFCKPGSIMLSIDGDDNLIGRQVFKLLNAVYQQKNAKFVSISSLNFVNNPKKPQLYQVAQDSKLNCWMSDIFLSLTQEDYKINSNSNQWISNQDVNTYLKSLAGDKTQNISQIMYLNHQYTSSSRQTSQKRIQTKNIKQKQPYSKKIQFRLKHGKAQNQDNL